MQALIAYHDTTLSGVVPNLPIGVPIDLGMITLFYTIFDLKDEIAIKMQHALAHRMFRYNQADLWWLVRSKTTRGYDDAPALMRDIQKRWRDQAFLLRMGRY